MMSGKKPQSIVTRMTSLALISLFLFSTGLIIINEGGGEPRSSTTFQQSLDGSSVAVEKAATRIIGQSFSGPGGKLGTFLWIGDIDQDGLNDLAVASSDAPGNTGSSTDNAGYLYIWLGKNGSLPQLIDLDREKPDILIRGGHQFSRLLGSIAMGDLNNDGIDDLVLGIPLHPECGRVFILWGKQSGWPETIDLYDPGRLAPTGIPYGFLRTDDYMIIGGHLAPVPWPEATYDTGDIVLVDDIDRDGLDDLIFSSPGWHHVVVLWGTGNKMNFGNNMTIIEDDDQNSKFGDSMDLGDIDNDGWPDLVVGAPNRSNETHNIYQCGSLFVYFNLSRIRPYASVASFNFSHPTIWGTGAYDRFASKVMLVDVDGDNRDDILAGAPDADGPQNSRNGAGEIDLFKGGSRSKFARNLDATLDADVVIYGDRKQTGSIPGDYTGRTFCVGDIDFDGEKELVIGLPTREDEEGKITGSVICYETRNVFSSSSSVVDLRSAPKRFEFFGSTVNDQMGYSVAIGDLDNDGTEEIISGAPGADGQGDLRVNSGEVYVFKGTEISISDISMSGPGYRNGSIFPGKGYVYFNFTFKHSTDPRVVDSAYLIFEPETLVGKLGMINGSWIDDARSMELDTSNSSITYMGHTGRVSLRVRTGWYLRIDRPYSVELIIGEKNESVMRSFHDLFTVANRIVLKNHADISLNGNPVENEVKWVNPGSVITFDNLEMVYDHPIRISAPYDIVYVELLRNGSIVDETYLNGPESSLTDIIPRSRSVCYTIKPHFGLSKPEWEGEPYSIEVNGDILINFNIDNESPKPVEGLCLEPDEGRFSIFDDDPDWRIVWNSSVGNYLDNDSFVKDFVVSEDGDETSVAMEKGGLFGTYFDGKDQDSLGFTRIDGPLDFSTSVWGPWGPDPNLLTYNNFSIRWHGWFRASSSRQYQFSVSGQGYAKVIFDNRTLIEWGSISKTRNSVPRFMNEGELAEVEIYYYNTEDISSFSFRFLDDRGAMVPVPAESLYYPGNSTWIKTGSDKGFTVSVRARDWVGHESKNVNIKGYIDKKPPTFDFSGFQTWLSSGDQDIKVIFKDPSFDGIPSSGIDTKTIQYRTRENDNLTFTQWMDNNYSPHILRKGIEGPVEIESIFNLGLPPSWTGSIQWKVSDIVGNTAKSSIIDMGIDSSSPVFEILSPNLQITQKEGLVNIISRVTDRPGSGVNGSSIQYKLNEGDTWSNWTDLGVNDSGQEIIFNLIINLPQGKNMIQFRCNDLVGNQGLSSFYSIVCERVIVNQPPVPRIRTPSNGTIIHLGTPITLDASNTTDDDIGPFKELKFTWISTIDGYLGSGMILTNVYLKSIGEHKIRLYVDDGQFNISEQVSVVVLEHNNSSTGTNDDEINRPKADYVTPLLIISSILIVLILGVLIMIRRYKKEKDEETRLDFVERTPDDEEYEKHSIEEEKALGIYIDDK